MWVYTKDKRQTSTHERHTTMARANKGGETGVNGEAYQGGQFLPNTTLPKGFNKKDARDATRKQQVAPYVYEVAPNGERSIYAQFVGIFGKVVNGKMVVICSDLTLAYYNKTYDEVFALATRWNNGEKWV